MYRLKDKLERWLNDYKLKKKLQVLYLFCVLLPLFVTDGIILYTMIHSEQEKQQYEMADLANAVEYNLSRSVEYVAATANNIYLNKYIEEFMNTSFETPLDYVAAKQRLLKDTLFEGSIAMDNILVTMYADNETIINGGEFCRLSEVKSTNWYQNLQESAQNMQLLFYYDDLRVPAVSARRKILFLRKMDFFPNPPCEKVVKIEIDYRDIVRSIEAMNYEWPVYICRDGKIMLSNEGHNSLSQEFENFSQGKQIGYQKEMTLYGEKLQIYILKKPSSVSSWMKENSLSIILLLMLNIILPWLFMKLIDRSITVRIWELSHVFDSVDNDRLIEIPCVRGKDEIGSLMQNYNRMAARMNELIQTVYKDKLKKQEMNIARQNAELLALHSQINPHFLFNALESIRMHSVLKKEYETADMVAKLAIMERQNVEWGTDNVEIKKEMEFVEAYLGLQKYRFGDRLSYKLSVEEGCADVLVPKLTIVTFVENACVHGIESKTTPGWIFVRIYKEKAEICIEVEDTGGGMEKDILLDIQERMQNVNLEMLKEKSRVGILNACLRLKMMTEGTVRFLVESEKGMGTMIQIRFVYDMPVKD